MLRDPRQQLRHVRIIVMGPDVLVGSVRLQALIFVEIIRCADKRMHKRKPHLLSECLDSRFQKRFQKCRPACLLAPMFCGAANGYSKTREPQAERRREQAHVIGF
jgi:hypothetical protein